MNRKPLILFSAVLILACCSKSEMVEAPAPVSKPESNTTGVIPGEIYVKLTEVLSQDVESTSSHGKLHTLSMGLNSSFDELGARSFERVFPFAGEFEDRTRKSGLHRWYRVSFDKGIDVNVARKTLMAVNGVSAAAPVLQMKVDAIPFNDPQANKQWHYDNSSVEWADVNVLPVWEKYTTGDSRIIVAVVDAGVQLDHEDLAANALAAGENGSKSFLYDAPGYKILPDDHGTHVAGTIAAVNNNGIGVSGLAGGDYAKGKGGVKILSCQMLHYPSEDDPGWQGDDAAAIKWAADHGAIICNNSWGSVFEKKDGSYDTDKAKYWQEFYLKPSEGEYSDPTKDAIDYFNTYAGCDALGNQVGLMKGGLVLFSAGNETQPYGVPACYPGALAVGSMAETGAKSSFSNYGDWVDIAAPGGERANILSTVMDNGYANMAGTSMACPHVAGVAALVVAACGGPGFTRDDLVAKLLGGASNVNLNPAYKIGPLVDALAAVEYNPNAEVPAVSDFDVEITSNTIDFSFTVPEYAGSSMRVYGFNVLASKSSTDWSNAVTTFILNDHYVAGDELTVQLKGLEFDTDYYVTVEAVNAKMIPSAKTAPMKITTGSNHAPEFSTTYKGDYTVPSWDTVGFPFQVSDPDGHTLELTYTKGSYAEELVKITDESYLLRVNGLSAGAGTYTAQFDADDGYGLVTHHEITYTIKENNPPVIKKQIGDIWLTGNGKTAVITLGDYVTDPDGEVLTVKTSLTGANKVAEVSKTAGNLTVKAVAAYGMTTVTVTVSDASGESVKLSFNVLIRPEEELASAYPNPVTDRLTVATGLNPTTARIRVISPSGDTVLDKTFNCSAFNPAVVDLGDVAPGRYTLYVEYDGLSYSKTIIKQ